MRDRIELAGFGHFGCHHLLSFCRGARAFRYFKLFLSYHLLFTLTRNVFSGETHPSGQEYWSMAENNGVSVLPKDEALSETLKVVVMVSN